LPSFFTGGWRIEFATDAHVWRSVGARLRLGQLHKSLIDNYKPFIHNPLQIGHTDQISDAPSRGRRKSNLVNQAASPNKVSEINTKKEIKIL